MDFRVGELDPIHFSVNGIVLTRAKQFPEAEANLRKALSLSLLQFAPNHYRVATTNSFLGACLADQKKFKEGRTFAGRKLSDHQEAFRQC